MAAWRTEVLFRMSGAIAIVTRRTLVSGPQTTFQTKKPHLRVRCISDKSGTTGGEFARPGRACSGIKAAYNR